MQVLMVGTALDTNGQKHRFVEAARRWGEHGDVTRALIAGEDDLAGVAARYAIAAEKLGTLTIRSAHKATAYFEFPADIAWNRSTEAEVRRLALEADVIHLTNDVKAYRQLGLARTRKPGLLHHHGTLFRNNPGTMLREGRRWYFLQAVSTIDLLKPAPDELHWLPTAYDMAALAAIGAEHRRAPDGVIRVVSAPTNREVKSTLALQSAIRKLRAEGVPVELVLVERKTWAECLRVKATADIYFDQVGLGYGCNAIEAWGMGIPVIAGADEWTLARMRQEFDGAPPFYEATEASIGQAVADLVASADLRAEWAERGRTHAMRFHDELPALTRLAELYAKAIAMKRAHADEEPPPEFSNTPGVFRTTRNGRLTIPVLNQTVTFRGGIARVDDPRIAERIRRLARFRPDFAITEITHEEAVA